MPQLGKGKIALAGLGLLFLAGCAVPAAYAPRLAGQTTGYTDQQLAGNRYRITFDGNSVTPRQQVEDDLLLRAAEVTLAAGYSHFVFDSRDTKADTRYETLPDVQGFYGPGFGGNGYGNFWRFHPRWGYDPLAPDVDIIASTRYQAYAEIVVLTDDQAAKENRAVNAHEVIAHLAAPHNPPV